MAGIANQPALVDLARPQRITAGGFVVVSGELRTTRQTIIGSVTVAPDGTLHIHTATAGAITATLGADDLVIENNTDGGITIFTPDADVSRFIFGSPSDNIGALVAYQQSTGLLTISTSLGGGQIVFEVAGEVEAMRITADGNLLLGGTTEDATATQVLTIENGVEPAAGVANAVQFYSIDNNGGHTIPAFFCEGTEVVATSQSDSASSVRVLMRINGVTRTFLCI